MEKIRSFIESGILESYVAAHTTAAEDRLVEQMAALFEEVRAEIDAISETFELYAFSGAVQPDAMVKPFLMATIDFQERLKNGEALSFPPELTKKSKVADYARWLNMPGMDLPVTFTDFHAKIIGYTPKMTTAIVWIKEASSPEAHDTEYEKFLILEGTCNITLGNSVFAFVPGDYFSIPLHKTHQVIVTSAIPCKVILQRVAA